MSKFVSITAAAKALGVSASTLRRWEAVGKLVPSRTEGGQRRYDLAAILPERYHGAPASRRTVAYARVSSHDQKADLERQQQLLELYCAAQGWPFEVIADLGGNDITKGAEKNSLAKSWMGTLAALSWSIKIACCVSAPNWCSPSARREKSRS